MQDSQRTCAERIGEHMNEHMNGRLMDFGALRDLADVSDATELATLLEDTATRCLFADLVDDAPSVEEIVAMMDAEDDGPFEELVGDLDLDGLREAAQERMYELPLGVSAQTVFRIELSTGGPADWLEVVCTGDTPCCEPTSDGGEHYEVERIVYHFADWGDHAERTLSGVDFDIAERFAQSVVPELVS